MTADPVYIFLLAVIVFLLYMIMKEREVPVETQPSVIQRVIDYPSYYGWWPSRFYGGYMGDVWVNRPGAYAGPHHRPFWGPHIHPGHRYF